MFERTDEAMHTCQALQDALAETGLVAPCVQFRVASDGDHFLYLRAGRFDIDEVSRFSRTLDDAWNFVRSIGTAEDRRRKVFLHRFSELLELGRDAGVDLSGLTPVFDEYRNNLLTHEAAE